MRIKMDWKVLLVVICALAVEASNKEQPKLPPRTKKQSRTVTGGDDVVFKCRATGSKPLKYRWTFKKCTKTVCKPELELKITSPWLKIEYVGASDNGTYTCHVSNSFGSVQRSFQLHVKEAPKVKPGLKGPYAICNREASIGDVVDLYCGGTIGPKPWKYRWTFMNSTKNTPRCHRAVDMNLPHLRLINVQPSDIGSYTCKVSNAFGSTSRRFFLDVLGAPKPFKKSKPFLFPIPHGSSVLFNCSTTGSQPLKYNWTFKEHTPNLCPSSRVIKSHLPYLSLYNVDPSDNGEYACYVSNSFGSVNQTFELLVQENHRIKPIVRKGPRNTSVAVGSSATLECKVQLLSRLSPYIIWMKWQVFPKTYPKLDVNIRHSGIVSTTGKFTTVRPNPPMDTKEFDGHSFTTVLNINNVAEKDFGLYSCCVSDQFGTDCGSAFLKKKEKS